MFAQFFGIYEKIEIVVKVSYTSSTQEHTMNEVEVSNTLIERGNTTCCCVGALVLVAIAMGVIQVRASYDHAEQIQRLEDALEDATNTLMLSIDIGQRQQRMYHTAMTGQLADLKQWMNQKTDHTDNTFSPIQPCRGMDETKTEHEMVTVASVYEDDELLNECYDSIPLNNVKKNMSITWLFK